MTQSPGSELALVTARPSPAHLLRRPKQMFLTLYVLNMFLLITLVTGGAITQSPWLLPPIIGSGLLWLLSSPFASTEYANRNHWPGVFIVVCPFAVFVIATVSNILSPIGIVVALTSCIALLAVPIVAVVELGLLIRDGCQPPPTVLGCGKPHAN